MKLVPLALGLLFCAVALPAAFVPTAEAGVTCVPGTPVCVVTPCLVSVHNDAGCIIHNPCDPRNCDPAWP